MNPLFSRLRTQASPAPVRRLARLLDQADAVVVGAGSGLSTSAGFVYGGERFQRYFSDFGAKYGFQDMYTGGFFPFPTLEEQWAYWSRFIMANRYTDPPKPVYERLLQLLKDEVILVLEKLEQPFIHRSAQASV